MPSNNQSGFYSYIQEGGHHDAWKIIVLVFVAALIVVLAWLFSSSGEPSYQEVPAPPSQPTMGDAQLQSILSTPSPIPPAHPKMTDAELRALLGKTLKSPVSK